ncbi:hypothetical protein A2841_02400 [Candidatus Kaiserbacteria bacterium RIFCSPHIGHO2_01_FULL_48_10]|uniref:Ribbon-helix-helix protein CopG domain-containing protein n=1 Tax=Candidatus Kaiserbacteria bacterium RIFCSPHIGHO2_01_FULL_48_10 TaxID=1798476 RepID=A0A1F6C2X1_9BACT|nr:MAG: hypothetical protein A2841_02400 [Candidatus Kaiserbacteria bacterium RIFCSPHIGHO2_01_FULL_48_10]
MRSIMNISLPKAVADGVKHTVKVEKFASVSEYFRHLLREEGRKRLARELNASRRQFAKGKGKILHSLRDLR